MLRLYCRYNMKLCLLACMLCMPFLASAVDPLALFGGTGISQNENPQDPNCPWLQIQMSGDEFEIGGSGMPPHETGIVSNFKIVIQIIIL